MGRIKVLQIITGLIPGGAERLLLDMMPEFDSDKFDVRLATIVNDLRALDVYDHKGTSVEVFDLSGRGRYTAFFGLREFIKFFEPDIIHCHMFHSLVAGFAASRFIARGPAICFTSHLNAYSFARSVVVRALKGWRKADILFTASQHPTINAARTAIIPNGVSVLTEPPARVPWPPTARVRLLAVGRLAAQKDPLGIVQTLSSPSLARLDLDFVGAGPLEAQVRALVSKRGLSNRVRFLGMRSDVRSLMRAADIFVMHSKAEGMPIALLEAGAEGMPAVATPVGAIPDVIGDNRGWLSSSELFAQTLHEVMSDPQNAIAAGRRLHTHVLRNHSIQAVTRQHELLYLSLAKAANDFASRSACATG